jgi:hypothetical protein
MSVIREIYATSGWFIYQFHMSQNAKIDFWLAASPLSNASVCATDACKQSAPRMRPTNTENRIFDDLTAF